jgi:predicted lipid-binding transport protein (Tim44 family)
MTYFSKLLKALAVFIAVVGLTLSFVDAKPSGSRSSSGSKGSHSGQSAPSTNTTAPKAGTAASPNQTARAPEAAKPSFMSRFGTGIAAGLLGAGLFGLLSGAGLGGALGSLGGILMLILQVAVVFFLVRFILNYFRNKQQPAFAGVGPSQTNFEATQPLNYNAPAAPVIQNIDALGLTGEDYNVFEQRLIQIQDAYGREALDELRPVVTPELHKIFSQDIAENMSKNIHNACGGAKMLQGDLSESWREGTTDYASVAMRYSLFDVIKDRRDGRVLEGSTTTPLEITEVLTFVRYNGGAWMLSAIEQA